MTKMDVFDGEANIHRHVKLIPNGDGTFSIAQAVSIDPGDINIGNVELKDGASTKLASIDTANASASSSTNVLRVQPINAAGSIITGPVSENLAAPFSVNNMDDGATYLYVGLSDENGAWYVKRIAQAGTGIAHATMANNVSYASYVDAWNDRAALTYGRFDQAF